MGDWPDKKRELPKLTAALRANTMSPSRYQQKLCGSERYAERVRGNRPHEGCVQLCLQDAVFRRAHAAVCKQAEERMCARPPRTRAFRPARARSGHPPRTARARLCRYWTAELPPGTPYVWTNDFHVAPVACYAPILRDIGARVYGAR